MKSEAFIFNLRHFFHRLLFKKYGSLLSTLCIVSLYWSGVFLSQEARTVLNYIFLPHGGIEQPCVIFKIYRDDNHQMFFQAMAERFDIDK